ncbi:HD-GYP domain-containing protein [Limnochorda sp.]|uniref:HD-GYP domain-containing protein n=1 Tax=Limnochorda sp. TaxID=1940279 RepID=UPI00396FB2DE
MAHDTRTQTRLLLTAGLYAVAGVLTWVAAPFPAEWEPLKLLGFFLLAWIAESDMVPIPQLNIHLTVSFAVLLTNILILGPLPAALVAGATALVEGVRRHYRPLNLAYNVGQLYVSGLASGLALAGLGALPVEPESFASVGWVLLVATFTAFLTNTILVDAFIATRSPSFWPGLASTFSIDLRWSLLSYVFTGLLGILMYYIYLTPLGFLGVALLLLAFVTVRFTARQNAELREAHLETMRILSEVLDARDPHTHGHSARVASLAREIAAAMNLPEPEQEVIESAALLHDIGKVAIQDEILFKSGALTDEEFARMREHPERGAQMIKPIGFLRTVQEIVRHHHERFDGKGYPYGVKGAAIPLGARIVAVADAWDAMTNERVYRTALDPERALEQLLAGRGTQFDPYVVDVFINQVLPARGIHVAQASERAVGQAWAAVEPDG